MLARITAAKPLAVFLTAATLVWGAPLVAGTGGEPVAPVGPTGLPGLEEETLAPLAYEYWRAPANTFVQYDDDATWSYFGAGCIYRTGGTQWFDIDLQLPDGLEITYLRVYFSDTDAANDAGAILFSFDGAGNYTELASVYSSGTPGQTSAGTSLSHVVDTTNEALALRIAFGSATTSSLRICGVRVQYFRP